MVMLVVTHVAVFCIVYASGQAAPHPPSDAGYTKPSYRMIGENFTFTCKQISGYSAQVIYLWNSTYRNTDGSTITDPWLFKSDFINSTLAPYFPSELRSRLTLKSGSENGLNVWSTTVTNINNSDFALYGCYNRQGPKQRTTITELGKFDPATSPLSLSCSQLQEKSPGNCSCESTGANPAPNFGFQVDRTPVDNSTDVQLYISRVDGGESRAVILWKSVPHDKRGISCEVTGSGGTSWRQQTSIQLHVNSVNDEQTSSSEASRAGIIAGAVVGVLFLLVTAVVVLVVLVRRGTLPSKPSRKTQGEGKASEGTLNRNMESELRQEIEELKLQMQRVQTENRNMQQAITAFQNQITSTSAGGEYEAAVDHSNVGYQQLLRCDPGQAYESIKQVEQPYENCQSRR